MKKHTSISIITITYNDFIGLKETIESIDKTITQNYIETEHIIINGNPNDKSDEYINSIKFKRSINTVLISEFDNGIYDAMNKGISFSNNDYLIFINSGDRILNNYDTLEIFYILINQLNLSNIGGVAFGCNYNFFNKTFKINPRKVNKSNPKMPTLHQGLLYKKNVLEKINFSTNYKICGDFDNFCSIISKFEFITLDFLISELVAGGISTNNPILLFKESRSIFKKYYRPSFLKGLRYDIRLSISIIIFQILYRIYNFNYIIKNTC